LEGASFGGRAGRAAAQGGVRGRYRAELSQDLPLVIEVVDTDEHIKRLEPILDEMMADGLVTLEKVRVLKYKPGTPRT
jgi:PII-like signaling protein